MNKRFLILLIVLISSFVLCIIYREDAPQYLLSIEVIFILIAHIFAALNCVLFKFRGYQMPGSIRLGTDEATKSIKCSVKGGLFPFRVKNTITFQIEAKNKALKQKLVVPFYAGSFDRIIEFPITIEEIGIFEVKPVKITLFDATGLIGVSKKVKADVSEMVVFPKCCRVNVSDMTTKTLSGLSEGNDDKFYTDHPGDDPSEIFGFREYREGDKPSHINWKLSAREKKLIVKEMSDPIKEQTCVIWNNSVSDSGYYNAVITTVFSVIAGIQNSGLALAVYNDPKQDLLHIVDGDSVMEAIMHTYYSEGVGVSELKGELVDEGKLRGYNSLIYITDQDITGFSDERIRLIKIGEDSNCEVTIDDTEKDLNNLWLEIR